MPNFKYLTLNEGGEGQPRNVSFLMDGERGESLILNIFVINSVPMVTFEIRMVVKLTLIGISRKYRNRSFTRTLILNILSEV